MAKDETGKPTGWRAWLAAGKEIKAAMDDDNLTLVAAGVAFYGMLALFPAIIGMVTLYALVADPAQVQEQLRPVLTVLPPEAGALVKAQLEKAVGGNDGGLGFGLVASLLGTLWATSGGVANLMTGLNIIYDRKETRNFVKLRAIALGFTLATLAAAGVALGLVAVFPVVLDFIGLDPVAAVGAQALRWGGLVVLVALGLSVLYRWAPDRGTVKWRWITRGSFVAMLVWVAASIGFSLYVTGFDSYDKTYGTLAAVIVLMMWLYLSAFAVLLGAEIDAVMEQREEAAQAGGDVPDGSSPTTAGTPADEPVAVPARPADPDDRRGWAEWARADALRHEGGSHRSAKRRNSSRDGTAGRARHQEQGASKR